MRSITAIIDKIGINEVINFILTSVFVVAIYQSLIQWYRDFQKYHFAQKAKWRQELREVSLNLCENKSVKKALASLKTNINIYGKFINNDISMDTHFWSIIDRIEHNMELENKQDVKTENMLYKKLINDFIFLLLKYDWECSKNQFKWRLGRILELILEVIILVVWNLSLKFNIGFIMFIISFSIVAKLPVIVDKISSTSSSKRAGEIRLYLGIISPAVCIVSCVAVGIYLSPGILEQLLFRYSLAALMGLIFVDFKEIYSKILLNLDYKNYISKAVQESGLGVEGKIEHERYSM